jgi:transcriptional regulator with XRE-family HTH domain
MPLLKLARLTSINESRLDQFELGKNEIRMDELLKIACALEIGLAGIIA